MARATLTINSRKYGSWSLRGWLLCKFAGLEVEVEVMPAGDPSSRAELLQLSPSFLVPRLVLDGIAVWDTIAIAEHLNEAFPDAGLLPTEQVARAHCRSISGEMHSGFANLRSALPMNLSASLPGFKIWAGVEADIARIAEIWQTCLDGYDGPYLFGSTPTTADAMFAPVCSRFVTYHVPLDDRHRSYCDRVLGLPAMQEWISAAALEPDELEELEIEF